MDINPALNSYNHLDAMPLNKSFKLDQKADPKKVKEVSQDFEAMFIQMSLKYMRPQNREKTIIDGGQAEDIFMQFMDEAIAKDIAASDNNFGIADSFADQL